MKKILYTLSLIVAVNLSVFAQAVLPTAWSFLNTTFPTGWSIIDPTPLYYTGSGNTPPAYKFDATGDQMIIFFASNPGNVTYYLAGNSFTAGGIFLVEESVNGTSWTTLRSHTAPTTTYTAFTDVPASASRYIRFHYSLKVGGNIGLDDVAIAAGAAGPAQEINIKQGTTTIVTGGTYTPNSSVGVNTPITFIVENLGTVTALNITSATISGTNAADFNVSTTPAMIAAASTGNLIVDFTPAAAGTRNAILTIVSDDADENPYIINLYGIGGTYASEPTAQATNLTFSNIKSYTLSASFTAASTAPEGYIILRKKGSAITDSPADGSVYQRGDMIGSSKVVYNGTATSFTPNNIVAGTDYYFAVFTYSGPGAYRNYLTTSPLTANVTSLSTMQPAGYYTGISTASATFLADLHTKIYPHTHLFYSNYGPAVVTPFASRDTTGDNRVVTCVYSGENKVYTEPFDWTTNGFSREHTYCHNWMPTEPALGLEEYEDYHHLFPTNQNSANAVRSNYPLGEVVTATSTYLEGEFGLNAKGETVYEPRDSHKGDAARAIFYEATCYTTIGGNSWALRNPISGTIPYGQNQNILKTWNFQDQPDAWEIARNDFIESIQGNRNPFVDSIQFACYIDFATMTKLSGPNVPCNAEVLGIADDQKNNDQMQITPNPNNGNFVVNYTSAKNQKVSVKLIDMLGQVVYTNELKVISGINPIEISVQNLKKGIYLFEYVTEKGKQTEKLVIE
ncbi:MAG: endonuclease [Bacteroidia bacterium]|nr:endonuclease [Bacteroidia bacterium]